VADCHLTSAGPGQPLILVQGLSGTVHNVNITGDYLAPDNASPAIHTGVATRSSTSVALNTRPAGHQQAKDVFPAGRAG